jgi:chromosome segregation ATPase
MPGKIPQQDGREIPTGKGEDDSPDPDVLALHAVLRAFALGDSFHALNSKVRENNRLRQRLDDLQITYSTNLRTLSEMNEKLVDKDTQHAKALSAQQEKLDSTIEAKKKSVADLAAMKKSLADKSSDAKDLDVRIQKLIRENKDKDTRIHALEEAERLRKQTAEEAKHREDQLREQLAAATDELGAQGGRLKQASDGLDLIRSFVVPLTTIRDNGDSM